MTMGADIEWAVLSIMTKIVTPKALGESGCRSVVNGDVDDSGGGREVLCSVGEGLEKGSVESQNFQFPTGDEWEQGVERWLQEAQFALSKGFVLQESWRGTLVRNVGYRISEGTRMDKPCR